MTAQEYILAELQKLKSPIAAENVDNAQLEDAIYAKVMSKKFRKIKADDAATERAKNAIHMAVKLGKPIKSHFVFGGNKLWRFDEAPEVDWAELFSLMYYVRWLKSIASVYQPGATIEFFSQDISVATLNNVPRSETDNYTRTFKDLTAWLKDYMPQNTTFTYRRHLEEYTDPSEYYKELEIAKAEILAENNSQLPALNAEQKRMTELNVRLRPGQTDDPQWREKVELEHQAIFRTKAIVKYFDNPEPISINAGRFPGLITLGSTKYSTAKFWAAVGALQKSGNGFQEIVLTPKQLESAKFDWEKTDIPGLTGKNFSRIRVI